MGYVLKHPHFHELYFHQLSSTSWTYVHVHWNCDISWHNSFHKCAPCCMMKSSWSVSFVLKGMFPEAWLQNLMGWSNFFPLVTLHDLISSFSLFFGIKEHLFIFFFLMCFHSCQTHISFNEWIRGLRRVGKLCSFIKSESYSEVCSLSWVRLSQQDGSEIQMRMYSVVGRKWCQPMTQRLWSFWS